MARLLLLLVTISCTTSTEPECITWSHPLSSKDDLTGEWRYSAEIVDGPPSVLGASVVRDRLRWSFDEDFAYVHDDFELTSDTVVLAFSLHAHLTVGVSEDCVLRSEESWYERSHAALDWTTEHVGKAPAEVALWDPITPAEPVAPVVLENDETGALERVTTSTQYAVRVCETCALEVAIVEHVLTYDSGR